jgi:hypothetical protein
MTERRGRGERGDVMAMTTIWIVFLMIGCWALISAGQQWGARRDAQAAAAAAARAGAQISVAEVRAGATALDPAAATARASGVMASLGVSGSVAVSGLSVTVTATQGVDYAFPTPGFPGAVTARSTATAQRGVQGDEGG